METVIGLDFGNENSYAVFISGIDRRTRKGGNVKWLVPSDQQKGIPSVVHVDKLGVRRYGFVATQFRPAKNRRNMLKFRLDTTEEIGGFTVDYNVEITNLVKHIVDEANKILRAQNHGETTDRIALAYPVSYTDGQRDKLVELIENVTLEDGRKLKVVGKIKESEAAALAYLSEANFGEGEQNYTVLVYDLGAGTFDASVVTAHQTDKGTIDNYEVLRNRGVRRGGREIDAITADLIRNDCHTLGVELRDSDAANDELMRRAERIKILLSDEDHYEYVIDEEDDDGPSFEITREDLEAATEELIMETIQATRELYDQVPIKPDRIVMVGGQSQMPVIRAMLAREFPDIGEDNIVLFRPHQAIAEGAARFGTLQRQRSRAVTAVTLRTGHMIGIGHVLINSANPSEGTQVQTLIESNSRIPLEHEAVYTFHNHEPATSQTVVFYQAKVDNPNLRGNADGSYSDFTEITRLTIDYNVSQPAILDFQIVVNIDSLGNLTFEARDPRGVFQPAVSDRINVARG